MMTMMMMMITDELIDDYTTINKDDDYITLMKPWIENRHIMPSLEGKWCLVTCPKMMKDDEKQ